MRTLLLVAASGVGTPAVAWSLDQPSAADFCNKEDDQCRRAYACPAASKSESDNALYSYYCRICQKKLDSCLGIAGLSTKTARHAPRASKQPADYGFTAPSHELKDPKFGTELTTRSRATKGVAVDSTDAADEEKTRSRKTKRARDARDPQ
jgi:hypothetical protein